MLLGLKRISAAFGLLALGASFATAQSPAPSISQNQATANAVASALKSSRTLSAYRIEIETNKAWSPWPARSPTRPRSVKPSPWSTRSSGVTGVVDQIRVVDARVRPAQYQMAMGRHGGSESAPIYDGASVVESAPTMAAPDG